MTTRLPTTPQKLAALYDQDYYLWLETTAKLLREGTLPELDIDNLLEEVEDIGRSEKRAVYSNLKILLMHLLKHHWQQVKGPSQLSRNRQRKNEDFLVGHREKERQSA